MRKSSHIIMYLAVAIIVIASALTWQHLNARHSSPSSDGIVLIENIPTPAGWYSWGATSLPLGETTSTAITVTFGSKPMDNKGNNSTTLINVIARDDSSKTQEQWIKTELYPMLTSLGIATSSRSWNVIDGRNVLEAEIMTQAGSYYLSYFLFDNGVEYSFNLEPSFLKPEKDPKNLANSADAQVLLGLVQGFVESLPNEVSHS